jgi:hypothetical protein
MVFPPPRLAAGVRPRGALSPEAPFMSARSLARRVDFQYGQEISKRAVVIFRPYVAIAGIVAGLVSIWACLA